MEKNKCEEPGCPNKGRYCRNHTKLKISVPHTIAKKSEKREKIDRKEYGPKARKFVQDNPICQAGIKDICTKEARCVHHKLGKNSKEDLLNEKEWLSVCFACHSAIHDNHAYAVQNGFSKSRHSQSKLSVLKKDRAA